MKHNKVIITATLCVDWLTEVTEPSTHIDNEYSRAGISDPKIMITTSRDPSSKLLQFTKVLGSLIERNHPTMIFMQEIRLVFPNSHRINRGNYVVKELADACRANDITDLIVLHEHRGIPGGQQLAGVSIMSTHPFQMQ